MSLSSLVCMITCKGVGALEFGFRGAAAEMPGRPLDNRLSSLYQQGA